MSQGTCSCGARGFTLIELLVVVAIIGLLASVILASLNAARLNAQHARALSDLHSLQIALELYRSDHGTWPVDGVVTYAATNQGTISWDDFLALLKPYISGSIAPLYTETVGGYYGPFLYAKGTATSPATLKIYDISGTPVACVSIWDGYYLDFWWAQGENFSGAANDGGVDPTGAEQWDGDVRFLPASAC